MDPYLVFLVVLLVGIVALNWRLLAARFGGRPPACDWSRIPERDREGKRAWFCPSCRREALTDGGRPDDCGARFGRK